jgi:hypothetical protein
MFFILILFLVKGKVVLRLREGGNISNVCSVCHGFFDDGVHIINDVLVCEDCYLNGITYDDTVEYYLVHNLPDDCSTVTWCPVCNRQACVESIGDDWFYHDSLTGCGCCFTKIDLDFVFVVTKKNNSGVSKYDKKTKTFV